MNTFDLISDLKIGHIVEVSGTTIRVELSGDVTELTRTYEGRVYPIGQIGSIVKVHFGRRLVFGFVTLLRMRSEELLEIAKPIPPDADQRLMEVELFAEGVWNAADQKTAVSFGVLRPIRYPARASICSLARRLRRFIQLPKGNRMTANTALLCLSPITSAQTTLSAGQTWIKCLACIARCSAQRVPGSLAQLRPCFTACWITLRKLVRSATRESSSLTLTANTATRLKNVRSYIVPTTHSEMKSRWALR